MVRLWVVSGNLSFPSFFHCLAALSASPHANPPRPSLALPRSRPANLRTFNGLSRALPATFGGFALNTTPIENDHAIRAYNGAVIPELRDFRAEDFETVWNIDQVCFAPGVSYTREELAAYMETPGAFTLVAESTDHGTADGASATARAIVGFLVAHANRYGRGHLVTIDVLPDARRFGVGSRLIGTAEERLRQAKCKFVVLETSVDNQSALAFYKRHQYFLVKTVPRYYANGVDAFVLQKDLLSAARAS